MALPQHLAHAELMRANWLSHCGLESYDDTFIHRPPKIRPIDRRD
jgi:hypothetical protein